MRLARFALLVLAFGLTSCAAGPTAEAKLLRAVREANDAYQSGDLSKAKQRYERLLEANPRYAAAHVRLGAIAYRQGNEAEARTQFTRAIEKDARNARARYNLAMLSLNDAADHLREFLTVAPQGAERERALVLLSRLREFAEEPRPASARP